MNAKEELQNIEQLKPIEKIIYFSHCYGMDINNRIHAEEVLLKLNKQFPNYTLLSPIHATGYLYDRLSYDDGMRHCLALLDMCDEMYIVADFNNSKGVQIEIEYARQHNIPVKKICNCNDCEWNNKVHCGVNFCCVPKCIK